MSDGPPIEGLRQASPAFITPPLSTSQTPVEDDANQVRRRPTALTTSTSHNPPRLDTVKQESAAVEPTPSRPSYPPQASPPTSTNDVILPPPPSSPGPPPPPTGLLSSLTKDDAKSLRHETIDPVTGEKMYDVNDVVEMTGWGWYQYKVVFVMGMMSFADAAEIWLATIILDYLSCDWQLSSLEEALIPACVYFWYAIGSILSGKMADYFGRYPVLLTNSYVLVISAVGSALAPNYYVFLFFRSITGFCIGGNYGTSIVYASEVMPVSRRAVNMLILEGFWTAGSVYELTVAYFIMDLHNSWRWQVLLTAVPCILMLILMHFMDESPRYLTITDQPDKAMDVVVKMCKQNKIEPPEGKLICRDVRRGEYGDIYSKPYTRESIIISVLFFCNMYLIFGIIILIPDMMAYNWCEMSQFFDTTYVNELGCTVYTKAEYLFCIVIALLYFPGFVIGTVFAESIGRIPGFWITIYSSAVFTFLILWCVNTYFTYFELVMLILSYAAYNEVLWTYSPEIYPSYMRATAIGVQNGIGKFGAAAGTFLSEYLDTEAIEYSLYTFCFITLVACVASLFFRLKDETKGVRLSDSREGGIMLDRVQNYGTMDNSEGGVGA